MNSVSRFVRNAPIFSGFMAFLIAILVTCVWAATRPNFEIYFVREVPSKLDRTFLGATLEDLHLWPLYYISLKAAKSSAPGTHALDPGRTLLLSIEPETKEWKRFEMEGRVVSHTPGSDLEVELLGDSAKKMSKLFETFVWKLEILPADSKLASQGMLTMLRGTARARTSQWRGRMFGTLMPKILMNQAFYVDMVKWGTLDPLTVQKKGETAPSFK